jgi:hypothetical protein
MTYVYREFGSGELVVDPNQFKHKDGLRVDSVV